MNLLRPRPHHLILLLSIASIALASCSSPSQAQHIPVIGIVNISTGFDPVVVGFKSSMADGGFVDGKTVAYVYDGAIPAINDSNAVNQEIQKVEGQNPDLYLTLGSLASYQIKDVLQKSNKPGVFAPVTNPDKLGLVANTLKPGGKMTGINTGGPLTTKGFEWLIINAPGVKRVNVYYMHGDATAATQLDVLKATADQLKVELAVHEVKSGKEAIAAVPTLTKGTDAILMIPPVFFAPADQTAFLLAAVQNGIPVGSTILSGAPANQLTGLTLDSAQMGKQAALLAQQILHGADPGTLPVEPGGFSLTLNLVTAKALGLTVPDSVLQQANTIIRTNPTPAAPSSQSSATQAATQAATASH